MEAKECPQCGRVFVSRNTRFCSGTCRTRWFNLHENVAKRPEVRAKIAEVARKTNRQAQMMTPDARAKANAGISEALRGRTLTEEHKAAIGRGARRAGCCPPRNPHLRGPAHPQWKGGASTVRNQVFSSLQYSEFRQTILTRDDWTCQECGVRGGRLHVHHIKPWGDHPELRWDMANVVTLCRPCHRAIHRAAPKPATVGPRTLADLLSDPTEP